MEEKRVHERYFGTDRTGYDTHLLFIYELLDDGIADDITIHPLGPATILNISKGGCLIHCHAPFPPLTRMLITMKPPTWRDDKIVVTGTVLRRTPGENEDYYCGIQFIAFHHDSKNLLCKFIDLLAERKKVPQEQA